MSFLIKSLALSCFTKKSDRSCCECAFNILFGETSQQKCTDKVLMCNECWNIGFFIVLTFRCLMCTSRPAPFSPCCFFYFFIPRSQKEKSEKNIIIDVGVFVIVLGRSLSHQGNWAVLLASTGAGGKAPNGIKEHWIAQCVLGAKRA